MAEKSRTMLRMCDLNSELLPPRRAELHAVHPVGQPIVRIPGVALMGAGGQRDALEHVPVEAAQDEPVQQARGDGESGLSVQGTPAQGQDGHIPEPGLAQGLAEQRRVVGRRQGPQVCASMRAVRLGSHRPLCRASISCPMTTMAG